MKPSWRTLTKDEEIKPDVEKAAWRRNLAWHFSDFKTSLDAKIEDHKFWKRIEQGEASGRPNLEQEALKHSRAGSYAVYPED